MTWMNIKMIGKLFGSTVAAVMDEAARGLTDVHEGVVEQVEIIERRCKITCKKLYLDLIQLSGGGRGIEIIDFVPKL